MTKKISSSQSTTFEWLLSILKSSRECAQVRVYLWRDRRPFAIRCKKREAPSKFFDSYDKSEYDRWDEVIKINDQFEVDTELLERLIVKVSENPYPGEQKRVLKVAMDLIPERGKGGWCAIFRDPGFDFPPNFENERITFPAEVVIDVRDVERKLWEMVRGDNTILAAEVPQALSMTPNGKSYRVVKERLKERGWVWGSRRESGLKVKIVTAPGSGTALKSKI